MIVMPANASGWAVHSLARETGRLGHLFSPGGQRGPWPWLPYALDNGAYAFWDESTNTFDAERWQASGEAAWNLLMVWSQMAAARPLWAIIPDVPGDAESTLRKWADFAPDVTRCPRALAVQDGMEPSDVERLAVKPDVIAVGGTTEWKWQSVAKWAAAFRRVHLLRCNSPTRLYELEEMGVESCDGTGWFRGDRKQTAGLEGWARSRAKPVDLPLWPHVCRAPRNKKQEAFA